MKKESIYWQHFGGINHYECVTSVNTENKSSDENSCLQISSSDNEPEVEPKISKSEKDKKGTKNVKNLESGKESWPHIDIELMMSTEGKK